MAAFSWLLPPGFEVAAWIAPAEGAGCEDRGVGSDVDGVGAADGIEVAVDPGLGVGAGDGCAVAAGMPRPPTRPIVRSDKLTL